MSGAPIDIHSHFFPRRLIAELARRGTAPAVETENGIDYVRYGERHRFPLREEMSDAAGKIAQMDRHGVSMSVLSVTMPGVDGLGPDASRVAAIANDELAEVGEAHPDRLGWVAVLPMDDPHAAAAELRRAHGQGARGAMIYSNVAGRQLELDVHGPVFAAACELDLPLLLHPTLPLTAETLARHELVSTLGYLFDTTTTTLRLVLDGMFVRYPDLRFVVCHAGSLLPFQVGRIDHQALNRPGGYRELAGTAPSDDLRKLYTDSVCLDPATLRFVIDFFGPSHVMMGSDHPQWSMEGGVRTLADTPMTEDERAAVAVGTASRVFGVRTGAAASTSAH